MDKNRCAIPNGRLVREEIERVSKYPAGRRGIESTQLYIIVI